MKLVLNWKDKINYTVYIILIYWNFQQKNDWNAEKITIILVYWLVSICSIGDDNSNTEPFWCFSAVEMIKIRRDEGISEQMTEKSYHVYTYLLIRVDHSEMFDHFDC